MEREGALVARYPLLIQKTLADKLSDKVQVIIAPPRRRAIHRLEPHRHPGLDGLRGDGHRAEQSDAGLTMILALTATLAIVVQDHASLRAAPRSAATELTALWQGDVVEIRGERAGYLKVYDYHRERGGYLRSESVRPVALTESAAPELLAVLRFLRETPRIRGARHQLWRRVLEGRTGPIAHRRALRCHCPHGRAAGR